MNKSQLTKSVSLVHASVMNEIQGRNPISQWVMLLRFIGKCMLVFFITLMFVDIVLLVVKHFVSSYRLLGEAIIGFNGFVWIWSPELVFVAIIMGVLGVFVVKKLFSIHSFLQPMLLGVGVCGMCILINQFTLVGANAIESQQIYFNTFGYRQLALTNHVKEMEKNNLFYGVVADVEPSDAVSKVTINHAGHTKSISMPNNTPKKGELVSVTFTTNNGELVATSMKRL
jgi:hypothetical protein